MTDTKVFTVETEEDFDKIIQKSYVNNIIIFMKFGATWCGPCKQIAPFFEKIANVYKSCIFLSIDVDKVIAISQRYNIQSLPTFLMYKNGKYYEILKGANPEKLYEIIKNQVTN